MIELLVTLAVLVILILVVWWLAQQMGLPEPVMRILTIVLVVVVAVVAIWALMGLTGRAPPLRLSLVPRLLLAPHG